MTPRKEQKRSHAKEDGGVGESAEAEKWLDIDFPGSYSGLDTFYKALKKKGETKTRQEVKKLLEENSAYQTSRGLPRRPFKTRKDVARYFSQRWEADLGDIGPSRFVDTRHGKVKGRYFLLAIDLFSKKFFVKPLSGKTKSDVTKAFKQIKDELTKPYRMPRELETDMGGEFVNRELQDFFADNKVRFKQATGANKARNAERGIRTFKNVLIPFLENNRGVTWSYAIEKVTENLNNRVNRSLGMTPNEVSSDEKKWKFLRAKYESEDKWMPFDQYLRLQILFSRGQRVRDGRTTFGLGDRVFIPKTNKSQFKKESDRAFSYQIHTIVKIHNEREPFMYSVADASGHRVKRKYYARELKKAKETENFPIEKIVAHKTENGIKYSKVRWMDHGAEHDQWVPSEEVY